MYPALLKVVNYYDLSVLSMSVMGSKQNVWMGWVGGVSTIQVYFGICLTLQGPLTSVQSTLVFLPLFRTSDALNNYYANSNANTMRYCHYTDTLNNSYCQKECYSYYDSHSIMKQEGFLQECHVTKNYATVQIIM